MARKRVQTQKLARLEARTRAIRLMGRFSFVVFSLSIGFVVVATAMPQLRALNKLEAQLADLKEREAQVLAQREQVQIELRALHDDPAFLEIHARDRLDLCKPGEHVIRIVERPKAQ